MTHTSADVSRSRAWVVGRVAVSIHSDVLFGIAVERKQEKHRTAGQGGPKTLPAAFWRAVLVRRVPRRNAWAAGPFACATRTRTYRAFGMPTNSGWKTVRVGSPRHTN